MSCQEKGISGSGPGGEALEGRRRGSQGVYVGEYSVSQDAVHVQPLGEALEKNLRRALRKDKSSDWVPVAVGDRQGVSLVLDALRDGQARLFGGPAE